MTDEQRRVYEAVPLGQKNAMKLDELCIALSYPVDGRALREVFEELNNIEHPVINLRTGYFRPETPEELAAYLKINHSYKCKFAKKEHHLKRALENFGMRGRELYREVVKPRTKAL